jgi:Ca2+-binding RTX toxin-like protein
LKLIPRATVLLDYFPLTTAADEIGGNDLMHGEAGDDSMHGMTGQDTMFAEGQDDDVIGGLGNDWMSGGTGMDGILGDDGRIVTSRDGFTEVLSGVNTATAQTLITTPGKMQTATINVLGTLKKTVNLTPFSVDPDWAGQADEFAGGDYDHTSDDVIYGGWGDDSLHGGSGDDAISGAEALPLAAAFIPGIGVVVTGYDSPVNVGNMLAFNPEDADAQHFDRTRRAGEFALYDEYNPLKRVQILDGATLREFLLAFDPNEGPVDPSSTSTVKKKTDGNDKVFGDVGNDWLVGGTGRDNSYGGWGNDLMNADDDHSTNGNLNDTPDTDGSFEDRAFGGAGRDVLIGNTGGDRLIDWVGEFNSYLVPFAPFGMATVSRTLQPQLPEFLYALSAADGADPTRSADTGAAAARNGEPEGELGLVLQKDVAWRQATGAPADPQAGNIPGGKRDVLRSANFNGDQTMGFIAETGKWQVTGGRYSVEPTAIGGDAVSLFNADVFVPNYFEVLATINAVKPTGGFKANGYIVFDYQSPTDFKFAGVNVSTNQVEIGHRTGNAWIVDAKVPKQLKAGQDYNLFLAVNGNAVMLVVDNQTTLSFTFAARRDADGFTHTISEGMIGVGGQSAKAQIDNVTLQKVSVTTEKTNDFTNGAGTTFQAPLSGTWAAVAGRYDATVLRDTPAISLVNATISPTSLVQLTSTFRTSAEGGFVFDVYSDRDFKFAEINAQTKQVVLGHRTVKGGWVVDATFNIAGFTAATDYTLGLTLKGTTVNVTLNGTTVISRTYNALVTDGGFGLFSRFGQSSFDALTVATDDPTFV